jgi:hypothetical protein
MGVNSPHLFMEAILNSIQSLSEKLKNTNKVLEIIFSDPSFQVWLLDLIRWHQLYEQGVTEDNVKIGTYSPFTKEIKEAQGVLSTHITLRDTGAFYESMKIFVNPDNIVIDAEGDKVDFTGQTTNLFEKYNDSGNLLGLTDESWNQMIDKLTPLIISQIWDAM